MTLPSNQAGGSYAGFYRGSPAHQSTAVPTRTSSALQDLKELVEALGHSKFILVGHDWGAVASWRFAACHEVSTQSCAAQTGPVWTRSPRGAEPASWGGALAACHEVRTPLQAGIPDSGLECRRRPASGTARVGAARDHRRSTSLHRSCAEGAPATMFRPKVFCQWKSQGKTAAKPCRCIPDAGHAGVPGVHVGAAGAAVDQEPGR